VPAPIDQFVTAVQTERSRLLVEKLIERDFKTIWPAALLDKGHSAGSVGKEQEDALLGDNFRFYGSEGLGVAESIREYKAEILERIKQAFRADSSYRFETFVSVCQGNFCAMNGQFAGTHGGDFLGEAATGRELVVPFGMHFRVGLVEGSESEWKVQEAWGLFEIPRAMNSIGVDLWSRLHQQLE